MFKCQEPRTKEEIEDLKKNFENNKKHLLSELTNRPVSKYERQDQAIDIPPMPLELFRHNSLDKRRDIFFKNFVRGDVLYFQVVNILPESYKLWALAKQNIGIKIDDLGLVMHLPKFEPEMKLLERELQKGDFLKAALCSCSLWDRKLYVTLDETLFRSLEKKVEPTKLGIISANDIPHFVGHFKNSLSYIGYIHRSEAFYLPVWVKQPYEALGVNEKKTFTFLNTLNGKTYPDNTYSKELKKKQRAMQSLKYYNLAVASYDEKDCEEALAYLNKSLELNPRNAQALTTRGTVYANQNYLRKAFIDTEAALRILPTFTAAKRQMSKLLIALARTHLEACNYIKAQEALKMSSELDGNNFDLTKSLLDLIPTKVKNLYDASALRVPKLTAMKLEHLTKSNDDSSVFRVPKIPMKKESSEEPSSSRHRSGSKDRHRDHHRDHHRYSRHHRHHDRRSGNSSRTHTSKRRSSPEK